MHKFGDSVTYQMGDVQVNALVVQSNPQPDGEHLVVVYLDPRLASNSMAGSLVDKSVAKAFASPLSEGKTYGWKELAVAEPASAPESPSDVFLDNLMPHLLELSKTVAEIAPCMEISPDGTLISANTLLKSMSTQVPAPVQPKNPAMMEDVLAAQKAGSSKQLIMEGIPSAADLDADANEKKAKEATVSVDEAQGEVQPGDPESPHAISKAAVAADPTQGADSAEMSSETSAPITGPDTSAAVQNSAQQETSTSSPEPSPKPLEPHETLKEKLEDIEHAVGEAIGEAKFDQ